MKINRSIKYSVLVVLVLFWTSVGLFMESEKKATQTSQPPMNESKQTVSQTTSRLSAQQKVQGFLSRYWNWLSSQEGTDHPESDRQTD